MIQYFGPDYDLVARAGWDRLVCEKCGHRGAMVIVQPNTGTTHGMKGGGGHNHQDGMSTEEATRRYHEFHDEQRRLGIKSNAELNAESRERLRAIKNVARDGSDFIGPPSPWKYRKKGRWL